MKIADVPQENDEPILEGLQRERRFDNVPFVVVILRPASTEFLLANTTFLKKISHASHQLRIDNVRGGFLGNDILREYAGLANVPENFDRLFAPHKMQAPSQPRSQ